MEESILNTIKQLMPISIDDTSFDDELIPSINTSLWMLSQIGVGSNEGFSIKDSTAKWSDFISNIEMFESAKTFVYVKTKILFDASSMSSYVIDSMERMASEIEWKLNALVDQTKKE